MNAENIKYEFPEMPEEIRNMIRNKVEEQVLLGMPGQDRASELTEKQMKAKRGNTPSSYRRPRRMALAILAAAMALGTSVFAGVQLYQMHVEKIGTYGARVSVENGGQKADVMSEDTVVGSASGESTSAVGSLSFSNPTVRATWIPDGLVEDDNGYRFHPEGDFGGSGISIVLWDAEGFKITDSFVADSEELEVSGHQAVYLTYTNAEGDDSCNHSMYINYPEAEMVVELYLFSNISREDAIRFAEGLEVVEKEEDDPTVKAKMTGEEETEFERAMKLEATQEEMSSTHLVGESFVVPDIYTDAGSNPEGAELSVCVSQVQVLNEISMLDPAYMDEDLADQADAEGKLLPNKIQYIRSGDGFDTLDEVLETKEIDQRLIYASVDYTNTGECALENLLFYVNLMKIQEENGMYRIFNRKNECTVDGCDRVLSSSIAGDGRMVYWDVTGGNSNGSNYIECLAPGETVTIHMGFIASEDELPYLYLSPEGGSAYEFTEQALETGYVYIGDAIT